MQTTERSISLINPTLTTLVLELGAECQNVIALMNQLQLPHLSATQKVEILAELLAATVHLQTHCGEEFQEMIAQEMECLPDVEE
jgi:hypothetical protein